MILEYLRSHIVPAFLLSLVIITILYLFKKNGNTFHKTRKYLEKEVIIRKNEQSNTLKL